VVKAEKNVRKKRVVIPEDVARAAHDSNFEIRTGTGIFSQHEEVNSTESESPGKKL
jgi:hypothetical protein